MFSLSNNLHYRLYAPGIDMRKSFDGLSALVREGLGLDPTNGWVYIFINKPRDKAKLLHFTINWHFLHKNNPNQRLR